MAVITSRDIADYIYAAVVIPLKGLEKQYFRVEKNPFEVMSRDQSLGVRVKPATTGFRHNYQRFAYDRTAPLQVILYSGYREVPVAEYDREKRSLVIFSDISEKYKIMPFMNQLHRMFEKTRPYYKVKMIKEARHDS